MHKGSMPERRKCLDYIGETRWGEAARVACAAAAAQRGGGGAGHEEQAGVRGESAVGGGRQRIKAITGGARGASGVPCSPSRLRLASTGTTRCPAFGGRYVIRGGLNFPLLIWSYIAI